jgi:hypothetical protein
MKNKITHIPPIISNPGINEWKNNAVQCINAIEKWIAARVMNNIHNNEAKNMERIIDSFSSKFKRNKS